MYRRILFAFDGKEERATQALPHLASLGRNGTTEIVLCHVVSSKSAPEPPASDGASVATAVRSNTRLDQLREQLVAQGVTNVRNVVLEGRPADAIVDAAADLDCDVILLVTAGRKGISRFFAGSVADEVVRETDRPVLLLRAKS